jgi:eukaryotic-like serine/threonine-protein kinase
MLDKATTGDMQLAMERLDACFAERELVQIAKSCLAQRAADRPRDAGLVAKAMAGYLESDLRRAERDMVRFFELSLDLFCLASMDGFFLRVNSNFSRVLGYPSEELLSKPFMDFVHPEDRDSTLLIMQDLARGNPVVRFRNRYRHVAGYYLWLEWTAKSVPHEALIFAVARDVTELLEVENP